jgi:subtilase family serine protease
MAPVGALLVSVNGALTADQPDLAPIVFVTPTTVQAGAAVTIVLKVDNRGAGAAPASQVTIYLSKDAAKKSPDALVLRDKPLPPLGAGASMQHDLLPTVIPASVAAGSYHLLFIVDEVNAVEESNKSNNHVAVPITVRPRERDRWRPESQPHWRELCRLRPLRRG